MTKFVSAIIAVAVTSVLFMKACDHNRRQLQLAFEATSDYVSSGVLASGAALTNATSPACRETE